MTLSVQDVHALERALVAAALSRAQPGVEARLWPAAGAVASRFLAVGTPRSIGLIAWDGAIDAAVDSLAAHRVWFQPRDVRCAGSGLAERAGGREVGVAEALACDIVCVHVPIAIAASQLRRGTHVNILAQATLDDELRSVAWLVDTPRMAAMAAGLEDGRQLDELTVYVA
jgi:hypothetical protein